MRRRRGAVTVMTVLALAGGTTACGGGDDDGTAPAPRSTTPPASSITTPPASAPTSEGGVPRPGADCLEPADDAVTARFGPGRRIGGYLLGSGSRYVVLAHQSMGDSCQMLPLARGLAEAGYHPLAFDFPGHGSVTDSVLAAIAYCRGRDAASVSLVGASMGGYAVLAAAGKVDPPVQAVVSLSAPAVWDDPEGDPVDISRVGVPIQLWAGRYDTRFFDDAKALARAQPAADLIILPNLAHGVELVPDALPRILAFLDEPR